MEKWKGILQVEALRQAPSWDRSCPPGWCAVMKCALRRLISSFPPNLRASIIAQFSRTQHGLQSTSCCAQGSGPHNNWRRYMELTFLLPGFTHQEMERQRGNRFAQVSQEVGVQPLSHDAKSHSFSLCHIISESTPWDQAPNNLNGSSNIF